MANEISHTTNIQVIKGSFRETFAPSRVQLDMAGAGGGNPGMVAIGTSEEDISFGADVTPGLVIIQNLDDTNFVQYGPKNASNVIQDFCKLLPGHHHIIYLDTGVTLRMIADTAPCNVLIKGYPT